MKLWKSMGKTLLAATVVGGLSAGCSSLNQNNQGKYPKMKQVQTQLESGKHLTIAYLGGSITWGATATDPMRTSWRALLTRKLEQTYPNAHIRAIDAAIGGKGSNLGVFRIDRDVIPFHPDLTFVEFAVNDASNPDGEESMEGIIRKLHKSNPNMAIVIVITGQGKLKYQSPRENDYVQLAKYYGLPVIDLLPPVNAKIAAGEFRTMDILTDGTHPNDRGYKLYTDIIFHGIQEAFQAGGQAVPFPQKPLTQNRFESARMIELSSLKAPGWQTELPSVTGAWFDHQPSRWLNSVVVPENAYAEIKDTLKCSGIGAYYEIIPDGSHFAIFCDGIEIKDINTAFSQLYPGMGNTFSFLAPSSTPRKIVLKAGGAKLRLGYLLVTE